MAHVHLRLALALGILVMAWPAHSTADASSLAGVKLVLDPGHGGSDPGAIGFGLEEADVNLDVALRARDLLEAEGATVLMTRTCDCTVSLTARTDYANSQGAHRFISVHANACGSCGGYGTETYYHSSLPASSTSAALATVLQDEVVDHLQTRDRGVKQADFHVLRETNMPAALVELAFVDHAGDNAKLADPAYRQEAARAILHAVQRHYGIAPHDPTTEPVPFSVSVVAPADGAWVRGSVLVKGSASDESRVEWMRVLVDGVVAKWVTPAPHEWSWDTTAWADGARRVTVQARATDGTVAEASVTSRVDNTAPAVALTRPEEGTVSVASAAYVRTPGSVTVAAGRVPVTADASDAGSGVVRVEFLVDGVLRASDATAPYAWTWDAGAEAPGSHVLTVRAVDRVGNAASSTRVVDATLPSP